MFRSPWRPWKISTFQNSTDKYFLLRWRKRFIKLKPNLCAPFSGGRTSERLRFSYQSDSVSWKQDEITDSKRRGEEKKCQECCSETGRIFIRYKYKSLYQKRGREREKTSERNIRHGTCGIVVFTQHTLLIRMTRVFEISLSRAQLHICICIYIYIVIRYKIPLVRHSWSPWDSIKRFPCQLTKPRVSVPLPLALSQSYNQSFSLVNTSWLSSNGRVYGSNSAA